VRRAALILVFGALLAGCGGSEETMATAETVEGTPPPAETEQAAEGDPAAGEQVFSENGCAGCHTFGPANANGTTGPNLDELPMLAENAGQELQEFTRESIVSPDSYVEEGFPEGVMQAYDQLEDQQLADLVAFLTQQQS
jgi:mono/diheme cytochrome c family protein